MERDFNACFISSRSPGPHITLEAGFTGEQAPLSDIVSEFCASERPFMIQGNGLGVFVRESPVLHWRWAQSKPMAELRGALRKRLAAALAEGRVKHSASGEEYLNQVDWQAKTSLAFKDLDFPRLPDALKALSGLDFSQAFEASGLSLYKYSEEEGENCLAQFAFGG